MHTSNQQHQTIKEIPTALHSMMSCVVYIKRTEHVYTGEVTELLCD